MLDLAFHDRDDIYQVASCHWEIIKQGVQLSHHISGMTGSGRDASARVQKDLATAKTTTRFVLSSIVRFGNSFLEAKENLEALDAKLCPTQHLGGLTASPEAEAAANSAQQELQTQDPNNSTTTDEQPTVAASVPKQEQQQQQAEKSANTPPTTASEHPNPVAVSDAANTADDDFGFDLSALALCVYRGDEVTADAAAAPTADAAATATAAAATATAATDEPTSVDPFADEDAKMNQILMDMFALDTAGPFQELLQSETVQDFILQHISVCASRLKEVGIALSRALGPFETNTDWAKEDALTNPDSSVDQILSAAKNIIVKMPVKGQPFQDAINNMSSAAWLSCQLLISLPLLKSLSVWL